jgi:parallel beta-helix repeat protein
MRAITLAWLGAGALAAAPSIFFVDLESGAKTGGPGNQGAPISIFGRGFGAERGAGKVTIGGVEVGAYLQWGQNNATHKALDMIVVQPGAKVTGGPIVVTVNGEASKETFAFTVSNAKILVIAPNGKDGGKCSEESPCKSILGTFGEKAKPGDVVLARGGNYDEGEIWIHDAGVSGTVNARKTLKNYPGETPVWSNNTRGIVADGNYMTFSGLTLRNGKTIGIPEHPDTKTTPRGNWLMNTSVVGPIDYDGMSAHGDDHVLAGNHVEVKGSSQGTQGHCYYVSFGNNTRILYNYGAGAPGYGLHLYDQPRQNNDFKRVMSNVLVEGNVMTASTKRSGMLMVMDDHGYGGPYGNVMENVIVRNNIFHHNNQIGMVVGGGTGAMRNVKIYNNTVYENGMVGIYISKSEKGQASGIEVKNNLVQQTDKSQCKDAECGNCCGWYPLAHVIADPAPAGWAVIENNGYFPARPLVLALAGKQASPIADAKAVTGALQFKGAAAGDFRVAAGAALDRGLALPESSRDFDGVARPVGAAPDLGAFESAGSGKAEVMVTPDVAAPALKEAPWAASLVLPLAGIGLATAAALWLKFRRVA